MVSIPRYSDLTSEELARWIGTSDKREYVDAKSSMTWDGASHRQVRGWRRQLLLRQTDTVAIQENREVAKKRVTAWSKFSKRPMECALYARRNHQHDFLIQGLLDLQDVVDAIVISRPGNLIEMLSPPDEKNTIYQLEDQT